jgi:transposase, IS6 family
LFICSLEKSAQHRQVKYLNNRLDADHGALKRLINPTRGFKTLSTASATIKELRGYAHDPQTAMPHARIWRDGRRCFVNRLFRLAA